MSESMLHTVHKGLPGETTQWDDIQVRYRCSCPTLTKGVGAGADA